ncbi:MAG TPA: DUF481 domain-containing protein [Tepidisphaeraceae bacterium]|nr:DUF481 domain-containing protein [Tepidisphaeraceae bacterium]
MKRTCLIAACCAALCSSPALADTVTLKNGDTLNGTVGEIAGGKMKFTSPVLGTLTIDMANVESFTTDAPARIQPKGEPAVSDTITGTRSTITTAEGREFTLADIRSINPPAQEWSGAVVANLALSRGNTDTLEAGVSIAAALRRNDDIDNDRFTLGANYRFGNTGRGDDKVTTKDNWDAFGKYDRFWDEKWYGFVTMKVERDRIANLEYRLSPGVGIGYQWMEGPVWNFTTEAGVSYVYESYEDDNNDYVALRLAYRYDRKLTDDVLLFHNLEWLPAFEDPADYILTTDLGVRVKMTKDFFVEGKVEWKRDSEPAEGALKNDLRYLLGVGWQF